MNFIKKLIKRYIIGPKPGDIYDSPTTTNSIFRCKVIDVNRNWIQIKYLDPHMKFELSEWPLIVFEDAFHYIGDSNDD